METLRTITDFTQLTHTLGQEFAERADKYDHEGKFVTQNYEVLKTHQYFSLLVPQELGGHGLSHAKVCDIIRILAHYCGSTALAFSMHQHLVAAAVWKFRHMGKSEELLRKVAAQQIVLVSTGARDWLSSNGEVQKTDGGYLVSGKKHFASQAAVGDIAITSAPFLTSAGEWKVLHFPISLNAEGVSIVDDWDVMGMRGTASQSIVFDRVFVPDSKVALVRNRDEFHPVWNLVLTVAMPLIMSTYVGLAERAAEIAIAKGRKYLRNQAHIRYIIGKLHNCLISARSQWQVMYSITNNLDFTLTQDFTVDILSLKTNVADACIQTVAEAMEAIGGQSFYRKNELERLFRDVQAAQFHPLPKWDQYAFCGEKLIAN